MAGARKWWLAAVVVVLATLGAAAFSLVSDSGDEPGWTSARGVVVTGGVCTAPAPNLGFSSLPRVREPDLSFAGYIRTDDGERLPRVVLLDGGRVVGRGDYYKLSLKDLSTPRPVSRSWKVDARMLALDENGVTLEEISHDRLTRGSAGRWQSPNLGMRVDEPGFYRLDIRIDRAGPRAHRYSLYVKAVDRHGEGRLAISGRTFRSDQKVDARIENLGSEPIQYGAGLGLQREADGEWAGVPETQILPLWQRSVAAGTVSTCEAFELDPLLPPGRYRLAKAVTTYAEPRGYNDHSLVSAPFRIVN